MVNGIKRLTERKQKLLRAKRAKDSLAKLAVKRKAERKSLRKEIRALERPRISAAKTKLRAGFKKVRKGAPKLKKKFKKGFRRVRKRAIRLRSNIEGSFSGGLGV